MINNPIVRDLLDAGKIKTVGVIVFISAGQYAFFRCKIVKIIKDGQDIVLKLRPYKDYPLGHKFIYRSIEEVS